MREQPGNIQTQAPSQGNYFDPVVLSSLGDLEISSRLVVEGFISGLHKSPYHGFNVEFAEHRQYLPGDDLRHIDWKAAAKSDKLHLKQFEEETNLKAYFVLDTSASMQFPERGVTKLEYAKILIASLSFLLLRQRDATGFFGVSEQIVEHVPPRGHLGHLQAILDALTRLDGHSQTRIAENLTSVAERVSRRGLIVIVSDLLQDADLVLEGLRLLRHRKHDVLVFQILTPEELEFPFQGYVRFEDMETHGQILTDPQALRRDYVSKMTGLLDYYRNGCLQEHVDYVLLRTSDPLDKALSTYLRHRMSRLKG